MYLPVTQGEGSKTETEEPNPEAVKPELLEPDLKLVNQHFADVEKWNARYCLASKNFGGTIYTAACLDFSLVPIPHSIPWVEVRALIIFKNENNQTWRVNDGIWHGWDSVKVPIRRGETQTLIVATRPPEEGFSTYEHRLQHDPFERTLSGDLILAHVSLTGEYMDEVVLNLSWWIRLSLGGISVITQEEFEANTIYIRLP